MVRTVREPVAVPRRSPACMGTLNAHSGRKAAPDAGAQQLVTAGRCPRAGVSGHVHASTAAGPH